MNYQNISIISNHLTSKWPLFLIIGLIYILLLEHKTIINFFKKKEERNIKQLFPIVKRLGYLVLGVVIILFSYIIVTFLTSLMSPGIRSDINYNEAQVNGFWSFVKYNSGSAGLIAVAGFVLSGICLMLSAGGRWLVNLSKLLITLSVFYLMLSVFVFYL